MRLNCNLVLVRAEIVLILTQDSYAVCVERTIGSDIGLTHLIELLGDVGLVGSSFGPFGDSANLDAR